MAWTTSQPLPRGAGCELGKESGWKADKSRAFMHGEECVHGGGGRDHVTWKLFLSTGDLSSVFIYIIHSNRRRVASGLPVLHTSLPVQCASKFLKEEVSENTLWGLLWEYLLRAIVRKCEIHTQHTSSFLHGESMGGPTSSLSSPI